MRRWLPLALLALSAMAMAQVPKDSLQMIVVTSSTWNSQNGSAQRCERAKPGGKWKSMGVSFSVSLGKSGLGWGRGLHDATGLAGPEKKEGDGKAPAGIFYLTTTFGYAPQQQTSMPYVQATPQLECVDDPKSTHYNQLVWAPEMQKDWTSSEIMRREDDLYRNGVFVAHNTSPVQPGAGSCIFLHIWKKMGEPTIGCTAMDALDLDVIISWLNPDKHPVLVQMPSGVYFGQAKKWELPKK